MIYATYIHIIQNDSYACTSNLKKEKKNISKPFMKELSLLEQIKQV